MRLLLGSVAFVLIALSLIPISRTARAESGTSIFQISCFPEVDFFEIRYLATSYEPTGLFDGAELDLTGKGAVLYAPVRHADFSGSPFPVAEGVNENPNYGIRATRFDCRLRTDAIELVVLPEPSFDLRVSDIAITLRVSGRLLIEDVPFRPYENRGPITRLVYDGVTREIGFEGKFGGIWPSRIDPRELLHNLVRQFTFDGWYLNRWVFASQSFTPILRPLGSEHIDYREEISDASHNLPVRDYRYRGPGAPAERLVAR